MTYNKIGSVNPCNILHLYNKNNEIIGHCLDTPNNFAIAIILNPNSDIVKGIAHYAICKNHNIYNINDNDIKERINTYHLLEIKNYNVYQQDISYHSQFIKIYGF